MTIHDAGRDPATDSARLRREAGLLRGVRLSPETKYLDTPPEKTMAFDADERPDALRWPLTFLVGMMTSAVLFGVGIVALLETPLADDAQIVVWPMTALTLLLGHLFAWKLAPRLRARNWVWTKRPAMAAHAR